MTVPAAVAPPYLEPLRQHPAMGADKQYDGYAAYDYLEDYQAIELADRFAGFEAHRSG